MQSGSVHRYVNRLVRLTFQKAFLRNRSYCWYAEEIFRMPFHIRPNWYHVFWDRRTCLILGARCDGIYIRVLSPGDMKIRLWMRSVSFCCPWFRSSSTGLPKRGKCFRLSCRGTSFHHRHLWSVVWWCSPWNCVPIGRNRFRMRRNNIACRLSASGRRHLRMTSWRSSAWYGLYDWPSRI